MHIQQYTENIMKRYDRNGNGVLELKPVPILAPVPEVTGRARDFFEQTSPVRYITERNMLNNAVYNYIDENKDGQVGLLEGIKAWFKFGVNGMF